MIQTDLLKALRKQKKWRQEDVSEKIGVSRAQYANIEVGNSQPSIPVLIEIIKVFGISFEELCGLVTSPLLTEIREKQLAEAKAKVTELEDSLNHNHKQ